MKKQAIALLALGITFGANAADSTNSRGTYVGGSLSQAQYKVRGNDGMTPITLTPISLGFIGGWTFTRHFGVEARLGAGIRSDTTTYDFIGTPIKAELKVDHYGSLLLNGRLPLTNRFAFVGLAGFTSAKLTGKATSQYPYLSGSGSHTDSSFSWAVGAEFDVTKRSSLSAEWGHLLEGDDYNIDALTISYRYHF